MKLLSVGVDAKTVKGEKKGYLTGILYLAPADTSGVTNVCANATPGCKASCLFTAGRAAFIPSIIPARIRKTKYLVDDRAGFTRQLLDEIDKLQAKAKRKGFKPCVRLNGTSDLPWLALNIAPLFPDVIFYDYTKIQKPWLRILQNYHLTFSLSETNKQDAFDCLGAGVNVAAVFDTKHGHDLPKFWEGYKVLDGDLSDLRFLDRPFSIVGLRAKGRAKKDCTGFVQRLNAPLVQIAGT